jgi:hypothetical protein
VQGSHRVTQDAGWRPLSSILPWARSLVLQPGKLCSVCDEKASAVLLSLLGW